MKRKASHNGMNGVADSLGAIIFHKHVLMLSVGSLDVAPSA
jgi:hypothetical protein